MNKIYAVTRGLGLLLAIAAAFVVIPNLNVAAVLVILGIITGLGVAEENTQRLLIATLVLPVVAIALGNIPHLGEQLSAIASNLGLNVAGSAATAITLRIISLLKADWMPTAAS
jgi:hypothetical protein